MLCGGVAACHRYGVCRTQHSAQYTYHTIDVLPHHCVQCNSLNTAHSTHTIQLTRCHTTVFSATHSTQRTVHIPYL